MKKTLLVVALIMAGIVNYACAHSGDGKKDNTASSGEVIEMNNDMFLKNVFDYKTDKEWKYLGKQPIIIDFYADWCGPCRKIAPIMKELAKEYEGKISIYKVDTDKEADLSRAMGIQSLPTVVFIPVDGQPQVIMGAADKATFKQAVDNVLLKEATNK